MTYLCGMIQDLLPLYIDEVCSEESRTAVQQHLAECETCRQCYEIMRKDNGFTENGKNSQKEIQLERSLKKVKTRISRRMLKIAGGSAAVLLTAAIGVYVLYFQPVKNIPLDKITVSAEVYPVEELVSDLPAGEEAVGISPGEREVDVYQKIVIPSMPEADITVSEQMIERGGSVSAIQWNCPYFMREIRFADREDKAEDTIYIEAFKTTVLNNQAAGNFQTSMFLEFREINRIVFVEKDGSETELWSR